MKSIEALRPKERGKAHYEKLKAHSLRECQIAMNSARPDSEKDEWDNQVTFVMILHVYY